MKRLIALVLALLLCGCAFAEPGNWYLNIAAEHAQKVGEVANDDGYIGTMPVNDCIEKVRQADLGVVTEVYCLRFTDETGASMIDSMAATAGYSDAAREKMLNGMMSALMSVVQGRLGNGSAMAAAGITEWNETYIMPVDFAPCAYVLKHDGLLTGTSFCQTGADTITVKTIPLFFSLENLPLAEMNNMFALYGIPMTVEKIL